jgi:hypothetical protein
MYKEQPKFIADSVDDAREADDGNILDRVDRRPMGNNGDLVHRSIDWNNPLTRARKQC